MKRVLRRGRLPMLADQGTCERAVRGGDLLAITQERDCRRAFASKQISLSKQAPDPCVQSA